MSKHMAGKLMPAVQYTKYGGGAAALQHVDVPIPAPKDDEILLRVEAATINPIDYRIQDGLLRPLFLPRKFPSIPGIDVSGEVVQTGGKVSKFNVGDKVVAELSPTNGGALAEYAVVKENMTVTRPSELSAPETAGLPLAGQTALQAVTEVAKINLDKTGPIKNVLVTAASGGVGHYAVQLAKLGNTHLTATCGARNLDLVRSLGADEVLDYKTPDGAALRSPSGKKYDYVVHCARGIPWATFEPNLSESGVVIDLTPGLKTFLTHSIQKIRCSKKKLVPMYADCKGEKIQQLVNLMKEGKIKTMIDSKHSLRNAEDAWARMIDGHATGKIIVEAL